jgi:hypothetical protein
MNDINERLCELLGCDVPRPKDTCPLCGKTNTDGKFIDGADFFSEKGRIDLLKRMLEQNVNWLDFQEKYISRGNSISLDLLLDDTGVLARAALKFLEGKEANHE